MPSQTFVYTSGDPQYGSAMKAGWSCSGGDVDIKVYPLSATESARDVELRFLATIATAMGDHPYVK